MQRIPSSNPKFSSNISTPYNRNKIPQGNATFWYIPSWPVHNHGHIPQFRARNEFLIQREPGKNVAPIHTGSQRSRFIQWVAPDFPSSSRLKIPADNKIALCSGRGFFAWYELLAGWSFIFKLYSSRDRFWKNIIGELIWIISWDKMYVQEIIRVISAPENNKSFVNIIDRYTFALVKLVWKLKLKAFERVLGEQTYRSDKMYLIR